MKKIVCVMIVALLVIGIAATSLAGVIHTPNGGFAKLWKKAYSTGREYIAYISDGNTANKKQTASENGRYKVNAYGYNSRKEYAWRTGWINTDYYFDE